MAITYGDFYPKKFKNTDVSSGIAILLVVFSILCGLIAFILCLAAEGSRSEVTWLLASTPSSKDNSCYYSNSGKKPLACAITAFVLLAIAMFSEHGYMLIAVTNPQPPVLVAWATPQDPIAVATVTTTRDLTWQICCLFISTWIFFALAEVFLMIGMGVESGHLSNWRSPRPNCNAVRPGLFAVAGIFGLITVFLGLGLYLTALRTQRLHLEKENAARGTIPNPPQ